MSKIPARHDGTTLFPTGYFLRKPPFEHSIPITFINCTEAVPAKEQLRNSKEFFPK